jgi:hypothetical protein
MTLRSARTEFVVRPYHLYVLKPDFKVAKLYRSVQI